MFVIEPPISSYWKYASILKKTGEPILILSQAQILIIAAFSGDENEIKPALDLVNYHLKRNYTAYRSHRKTRLRLLK